ncbi:LamG domain-containing protein [Arthrobacter alpinus]|nr:LamG domain-containing protein [Arthrobacter alpinus]
MSNDGRINFGIYPGSTVVVQSSQPVNDGKWHQIVATMTPGKSELFIDASARALRHRQAPRDTQDSGGSGRITSTGGQTSPPMRA